MRTYCTQAGPFGLYCDRIKYHLGWHSRMRAGKFYEWQVDQASGRVISALRNGEVLDPTAGALPSGCPNHDYSQICPDCTS